jgi:hypothetical protein
MPTGGLDGTTNDVFGTALEASMQRVRATLADLRPWKEGLVKLKVNEAIQIACATAELTT